MIALLGYQCGLLFRSHRWVFPLIVYAALISVGGAGSGGQSLSEGLDWSAAILVPVVALLTRSMLTAEPGAARACVAVVSGPARAQLATLITAFAAGVLAGLAGAGYELLTSGHQTGRTRERGSCRVPRMKWALRLQNARPWSLALSVTPVTLVLAGRRDRPAGRTAST